jgi:hypothetical protein
MAAPIPGYFQQSGDIGGTDGNEPREAPVTIASFPSSERKFGLVTKFVDDVRTCSGLDILIAMRVLSIQ